MSAGEAALRDAVVEHLRGMGIEVITDTYEGQRVLDAAKRAAEVLTEAKKRNQQKETALPEDETSFKGTAISSADGAKVLQNLEQPSKNSENITTAGIRTFLGDIADAIGATKQGSNSRYATFETVNGEVVTIRLAEHNAHTSGFDHSGRDNGISIVISRKPNAGINNDGKGNKHNIVLRKGNEKGAGVNHSVFRHYGTRVGVITADDILLIPDVIKKGDVAEKQRGNVRLAEYRYADGNGIRYTVVTEVKNGYEQFNDYYTNKKVSNQTPEMPNGDTQLSARPNDFDTNSDAKLQKVPEPSNEEGENDGNSAGSGRIMQSRLGVDIK